MSYETIIYNHTEKSPFKVTEADIIIAELEKIKAKIKDLAFDYDDFSPDKELVVDLDKIEEVFNRRISELKGGAE